MTSSTFLTLPSSESTTPPPASPTSPNVPNVFVIPPEEEQSHNPPWCFFDADEDLHTSPDLHQIDSALAPAFHRMGVDDVVMPAPSRSGSKRTRPTSVMTLTRDESFGDIVEVVRVGRGEAEPSPDRGPPAKRPKTLKSRAASALRSIKNVGKSKSTANFKQKRRSTKEMLPTRASAPAAMHDEQNEAPAAPRSPPRRRKSVTLSQLFTQPVRNKSSFDLVRDVDREEQDEGNDADTEADGEADPADVALPPSPATPPSPVRPPSTASVRPPSILRRMFSFNSIASGSGPERTSTPVHPAEDNEAYDQGESTPEPEVMALRHVPSVEHGSLAGRSHPSTPVLAYDCEEYDDQYEDVSMMDVMDDIAARERVSVRDSKLDAPAGAELDRSLEMRLDSLHFDSLSFDPENFGMNV